MGYMHFCLRIVIIMTNLCQIELKLSNNRSDHAFSPHVSHIIDIVIGTDSGRLSATSKQQFIGSFKLPNFNASSHSI